MSGKQMPSWSWAAKAVPGSVPGEFVMPDSAVPRGREVLISVRRSMRLGSKAFAERLNEVLGPVQWPQVPVTWRAIRAWETVVIPPEDVVDAALTLLRYGHLVDLDAEVMAA